MKKTKKKYTNKEKWPSVRSVFLFVTIVFSLTMGFLVFWQLWSQDSPVHKVKIELQIPKDSLTAEHIMKGYASQLEMLASDLNKQSHEISDKYELLLKSKETESGFFRLAATIAAFIVTLIGFLGYRTIKDIENKALSIAETKAGSKAQEYTQKHLEQEVEKQLNEIVRNSTAAQLLKEQIMKEFISSYVRPIENKLSTLESTSRIEDDDLASEEGGTDTFPQIDPNIDSININGLTTK